MVKRARNEVHAGAVERLRRLLKSPLSLDSERGRRRMEDWESAGIQFRTDISGPTADVVLAHHNTKHLTKFTAEIGFPPSSLQSMHPNAQIDAKRPPHQLLGLWIQCLNREISNSDRGGWIYVFYEDDSLGGLFKVGRTNDLARRISEWTVTCPGKWRTWLGAFWTPFATRTESLVHLQLEYECTSRPRSICSCGVRHMEKFAFSGNPQTVYEDSITSVIVEVITLVKGHYQCSGLACQLD
ncbi:hypothetical protein FB446DRAFT_708795 [Lentinula raphanica]|nr:hypothetical protein FB446DRAFT_708795 [Lentinula raphanica]